MSYRVAKSAPKQYLTKGDKLQNLVISTMQEISDIIGSSMGPGGRPSLLEAELPGMPNKITKDGVTIFKALGAIDPYKHLIIETARDSSQRTASEAGDGTTTTAVLAHSLVSNIFAYCQNNPKQSPQKVVRKIRKVVDEKLLPFILERAIKVGEENKDLLRMVAQISANGDKDLADAVIRCFEEVGFGEASHVTIRELPGPNGYKVERIEGFPIPIGFEETAGKYHPQFINDIGNQRCYLKKPKFLIFDGSVVDFNTIGPLLDAISEQCKTDPSARAEHNNIVVVANGFSENVISTLAYNFLVEASLNILPVISPMVQFMNGQSHFLADLAAFTGAKVFGMTNPIDKATLEDLGSNMTSFECFRFRSNLIGEPEALNIEHRAEQIRQMKARSESRAEETWFEERLGKITSGIAKLTISSGSMGEIKEKVDRADDAICAVRSTIVHGCLPGGCRLAIDMALKIGSEIDSEDSSFQILVPSLLSLHERLLDNAGYSSEEVREVLEKLSLDPDLVYDIENQVYGRAEELGLFDATKAVYESLNNAVSIASVLGTLGGIVCQPRDGDFERSEAKADEEFRRVTENPDAFQNPALRRK